MKRHAPNNAVDLDSEERRSFFVPIFTVDCGKR